LLVPFPIVKLGLICAEKVVVNCCTTLVNVRFLGFEATFFVGAGVGGGWEGSEGGGLLTFRVEWGMVRWKRSGWAARFWMVVSERGNGTASGPDWGNMVEDMAVEWGFCVVRLESIFQDL
jgi:hypothetical protein